MTWYLDVVVVVLGLQALLSIITIGELRAAVTPADAVIKVVLNALIIWAIIGAVS